MALRRREPPAEPQPCACGELEAAVAALARFAARNGGAADVYLLPGNQHIDNRADAALIRKALAKRQPA